MKIVEELKKLFEKNNETTFSIDTNSPEFEVGSIHEDNYFFHGTKFEILTVSEVEEHPDRHFPYTIKGTCKILSN